MLNHLLKLVDSLPNNKCSHATRTHLPLDLTSLDNSGESEKKDFIVFLSLQLANARSYLKSRDH